jgi:hypothetical protein
VEHAWPVKSKSKKQVTHSQINASASAMLPLAQRPDAIRYTSISQVPARRIGCLYVAIGEQPDTISLGIGDGTQCPDVLHCGVIRARTAVYRRAVRGSGRLGRLALVDADAEHQRKIRTIYY